MSLRQALVVLLLGGVLCIAVAVLAQRAIDSGVYSQLDPAGVE